MPITADYHLHSHFSGDSQAPMEEMIQQGIHLGLTHMCFTEHMDIDYIYADGQEEMFLLNTDSYLYDLIRCKEKYQDSIKLAFGVELGLQPHITKELAKYVKAFDFDFVIASSHLCNRKDPYYPSFFEGRTEEEAFMEYFTATLENIKKFSNFDVCGHLDYVVRYSPSLDQNYSYEAYRTVLDAILTLLIDREKGIEINTGGLKNGLRDVHPCKGVIKRYKELGGEIVTIGSDAHTPQDIARSFAQAEQVLTDCGFRYYCTFHGRMAEYHKL